MRPGTLLVISDRMERLTLLVGFPFAEICINSSTRVNASEVYEVVAGNDPDDRLQVRANGEHYNYATDSAA